jgi:hypothetical protein
MHGHLNVKFITMHGHLNVKFIRMHGQLNVKIAIQLDRQLEAQVLCTDIRRRVNRITVKNFASSSVVVVVVVVVVVPALPLTFSLLTFELSTEDQQSAQRHTNPQLHIK